MELSLFYFAFILLTLLSTADPTEFDIQRPTARRLLLFGGFNLPTGEKKSHHRSSSSKSSSSSPPKYARSSDTRGLTVYIRPQTANELGHKVRSYTHLLKSKLYTTEEKAKLKRLKIEKKKQLKKKNPTQHKSSIITKTQELVTIDNDELNRCRALLHIDSTTTDNKKQKKSKKDKSIKQIISSKVKNVTAKVAKNIKQKVAAATKNLPINDKKIKPTKISSPSGNKPNENRPVISPVKNIPSKTSPPPPPPSQSTIDTKSKRIKSETIAIIKETAEKFDSTEDEIDDKNNSVVGRAYHFVKNMFQLSDNLFDDNQTAEGQIIDTTNEQQQQQQQQQHSHHHSRKLLSIDENDETPRIIEHDTNDFQFALYLNNNQLIGTTDDLSFVLTSISKRQLLSVKTSQHSASSKPTNIKDKKLKSTTNPDANKPKVGWAYRYRISRYLDAQKLKRTGNKNKQTGGGKIKHPQKQHNQKKTSSSSDTKISKRKLLQYDTDDDSSWDRDEISDQDIINSVSITKKFSPKRQLLTTKTKDKHKEDDEDDLDQINTRRRMKSFEELTDPIAIVHSYDRGLYKPRVGWQFRYRVSRYIDSLRENIREDQERLKLGLQAIRRKTPQELSGRRKRVLDKSFASDSDSLKKQEKTIINEQKNKPNAGWRYRYRISKMLDAKNRGDFIDDEEEKRKARLEQTKKQPSHDKSRHIDDEPIEGENDLDPDLRKINNEGRRVGWAYRYRIRRKLDHLKQQQAETGIPFDWATLSGKREKKVIEPKIKSIDKKTTEPAERKSDNKTKSVGWQYRYRVSKMNEAQKREKSKAPIIKKQDRTPAQENLDPQLARLAPEERTVGWKYRYRIRRKLDSIKNAASHENGTGKRAKKSSSSPAKRKNKEKIINQVEESIEKILNIDDIDKTPFMEYFRRTSSYILFGLVPTAKKSLCLLPLPITFSFCNQETNEQILTTEQPKRIRKKKLKTKKEHRAKQFIRSRITKLGAEDKATERRVDETMKKLYKKPSLPPLQTPPLTLNSEKIHKKERIHPPQQPKTNEQEEPIQKVIGVKWNKNKNKKKFQIIGNEVKIKHKHLSHPSTVTTPPPIVEVPTSTAPPRLQTISEVIQEEAATILAVKHKSSSTPEEIQDEINETNELIQEQKKRKATITTPSTLIDSTTSGEEDNDSASLNDNDRKTNGGKVHDILDLEKDKN